MDTLTHLLVGHAMGAAASSVAGPFGTAAYWGAFIGNSLPDIDVPLSLLLRRNISLHRTITHTIPGAVLLSAVTTVMLQGFLPGTPPGVIFASTLAGTMAHMVLDCLNLFGARPFWPLSGRSVNLGVLHILDPVLLLLLGLPAIGVTAGMAHHIALSLSFVLIWPYVLYRLVTARKLNRRLKAEGSVRARVIPWFSSWRYLFETPTSIEFGRWNQGRRRAMQTYLKADSPLIRASLRDPKVAAFLQSAEYPYARILQDNDGHAVVWADALRQLRADFRPLRIPIDSRTA